jgi:hypothetical protein
MSGALSRPGAWLRALPPLPGSEPARPDGWSLPPAWKPPQGPGSPALRPQRAHAWLRLPPDDELSPYPPWPTALPRVGSWRVRKPGALLQVPGCARAHVLPALLPFFLRTQVLPWRARARRAWLSGQSSWQPPRPSSSPPRPFSFRQCLPPREAPPPPSFCA